MKFLIISLVAVVSTSAVALEQDVHRRTYAVPAYDSYGSEQQSTGHEGMDPSSDQAKGYENGYDGKKTDAYAAPTPEAQSTPASSYASPTAAYDSSAPVEPAWAGSEYGGSKDGKDDKYDAGKYDAGKYDAGKYDAGKDVKYGSGSGGNSDDFDSCVATCKATLGQSVSGSPSYSPSSSSSDSPISDSSSNSSTPTSSSDGSLLPNAGEVVVAPKKGDLRMVPFAIEIAAGQTLTYIWGAGPHTVTQSSPLAICNKTLEEGAYASGQQNATHKFPVVIKQDSKPTYYFCGVKTHCQMGMFGIVNPKRTKVAATGFGAWMDQHAAKDEKFAKYKNETDSMCQGSSAMSWGSMFDLSELESWALPIAAESVMATRQYYFRNPQVLVANRDAASANTTDTASATSTDASPAPDESLAAPVDEGAAHSGTSLANNQVSAASTLVRGSTLALAVVAGLVLVF